MPFIKPAHTYAISINTIYREHAQVRLFCGLLLLEENLFISRWRDYFGGNSPAASLKKKYGFVKADED